MFEISLAARRGSGQMSFRLAIRRSSTRRSSRFQPLFLSGLLRRINPICRSIAIIPPPPPARILVLAVANVDNPLHSVSTVVAICPSGASDLALLSRGNSQRRLLFNIIFFSLFLFPFSSSFPSLPLSLLFFLSFFFLSLRSSSNIKEKGQATGRDTTDRRKLNRLREADKETNEGK